MYDDRTTDGGGLAGQPGLLVAIRRNLWVVIVATVLGAALAAAGTSLQSKSFQATAQIFLGNPNDAVVFRTVPTLQPASQALAASELMHSNQVYARAAQILGAKQGASLQSRLTITPSPDSAVVTISATGRSAKKARDLANAESQAYLDVSKQERVAVSDRAASVLKTSVAGLQQQAAVLRQQLATSTAAAEANAAPIADPTNRAKFVQAALANDGKYQALQTQLTNVNTTLSSVQQKQAETQVDSALTGTDLGTFLMAPLPNATSSIKRNTAIGAAVGLLLGAALAWRLAERRRLPDGAAVATALGAPQLGVLPATTSLRRKRHSVVDLSPGNQPGDDLKVIASTLLMYATHRGLDSIVVTSARPQDGRTTLTLNIAAAAAVSGRDVVLVDADTRHSDLTQALGFTGRVGLTDVIANNVTGEAVVVRAPVASGVPFVPAGTRLPGGAALPVGWRLTLPQAADGSGPVALIDAPSTIEDPTALQLAARRAGLLIAVSSASSPADLATLRARAELSGVPILGFVLNEARGRRRRTPRRVASPQDRQTPAPVVATS